MSLVVVPIKQKAAKAIVAQLHRVITYTRADESGSALKAAGFRLVAVRPARSGWDCESRPRDNTDYDSIERLLWEATP